MSKLTNEITRVLVSGWLDYPEKVLEEQGIDYSSMSEEEIDKKVEEILDEFEYIDTELDYYDLEKSYECNYLYYKHEDKLYGVYYIDAYYDGVELRGEPFEVEPYEITITKYRPKNETD